jgi:membrane protease YdiL (CAAX protease family)
VVQLLRRYVKWHVGFQWYVVALFGFPALYLLATSLLLGITPLNALMNQWPLFFNVYLPTLLFGLVSPLGEETGWRGFALPRLQQRHGALLVSLILGSLWALWHLPLYFVTTPGGIGPFNPTLFVVNSLQIIIVTIFITWVFNNTRGSLLIAILLHASSNATPSWFLKLIPTLPPLIGLIGFVLFIVFAVLIIVFTKGRLSYTSDRVRQPVEAFQTAKRPLTN